MQYRQIGHCPAGNEAGSGTGRPYEVSSDFPRRWHTLTLLHLKVLFLSPGTAAAKPSLHAVYPSSGYLELSIAPEASSASHSAWKFGQSCLDSELGASYHLHTHDAGMH
jgi:hypothetical protein